MNLCYNCFRELPGLPGGPGPGEMPGPGGIYAGGPCPYCGFDPEENAKKYPAALRAGTVLNNRYIVGRVLGQGGFGITYLAWDEKLAAKVAVKEYMPYEIAARIGTSVSVAMESRAEDFTYGGERFREEARTLAKFMGQPNIAGVTDYFDENDTSYFVMDYIEGISFKTYIANAGGKVSVQEALDVMIPVLRALTAVHAEGFIHRDVTPDNIYITKDGNVKLLDFGSARYSLGDKSKSLDVILKVGYAPKEQYIRRGRQGPYTDVYSCAACLYAAITGYLPPESLERLDHDGLVPPSQAGVEIPLYLERAILKGLAVQPEDRFQTAGEFLEALESRKVVELPGGDAGQADAGQKAGQPPTELEQYQIYLATAKKFDMRPVTIRLADLGADKLPDFPLDEFDKDNNPFMGCRGIRLFLKNPELMHTQLRAIVRTACEVPAQIKIMVPMLSSLEELRHVRAALNEVLAEFEKQGKKPVNKIALGAMIEVPAAAIALDGMIGEMDFLSIGTNDLIQYLIAVDRVNPEVAHMYDPCHPAVVRTIRQIIQTAHQRGRQVSICGEIASDVRMVPMLLGLEVDTLSVPPRMFLRIKNRIRNLNFEACSDMAQAALLVSSSEEIRKLIETQSQDEDS